LRVAVADEALGAAWVYDARGRKLAEIDGLDRPSALAYAPNGTLLIAERGGGRVIRWSLVARAPDAED
jgi:hypothetical protein